MFKLLTELNIDKKNHKDLAILPGFNINMPEPIKESSNVITNMVLGDKVIDDNVFAKFFTSVDETNNNSSRKKKLHSFNKNISNKSNKNISKNRSKKLQRPIKANKANKTKKTKNKYIYIKH
jgi:predicted ATP-dependent endonuclease of OLD family